MDNYSDIINLEHYELKNHERMSRYNRASQFAPFAALTGYSEQVMEVARITNERKEITVEEELELNQKLNIIVNNIKNRPFVKIKYFKKDLYKDGGEYIIKEGNVKRIDLINKFIKFTDNMIIYFIDIIDINYEDNN